MIMATGMAQDPHQNLFMGIRGRAAEVGKYGFQIAKIPARAFSLTRRADAE
jgi:hypothetical protein